MMNNSQFDNKVSNTIVNTIGTLIRAFERALIVFFDGLRMATVHGTPSIVGFFAALSPLIAPMAMAAMTSVNLQAHFHWLIWQAFLLGVSLEVVGFPLWVFTTESIFMDGWKGTTRQMWLLGSVIVYEAVIIVVNAILGSHTLVDFLLLLFLCMLPALCGVAYSYSNKKNEQVLANERQEVIDAQIRAEQNELKLKGKMIKAGLNPQAPVFNSDTPKVTIQREKKGDWRLLTSEQKHEIIHVLQPTQIMQKHNVSRSTAFEWKRKSDGE
jgi:hypothetical protein